MNTWDPKPLCLGGRRSWLYGYCFSKTGSIKNITCAINWQWNILYIIILMERQVFSYKIVENSSWLSQLSDLVAGKVMNVLCPSDFLDWAGYPLLEHLFSYLHPTKKGDILEIGPGSMGIRFMSHLQNVWFGTLGVDLLDLSFTKIRHPNVPILEISWENMDIPYGQRFKIVYHHRIGPQLSDRDKFGPTHERLEEGGYYVWCKRWGATTLNEPIPHEVFAKNWYNWGVIRVEKTFPTGGWTDTGYDIIIMQKNRH